MKGFKKAEHRTQNTEHRLKENKRFAEKLRELKKNSLVRKLTYIESSIGSRITINGKRYINFSSNDYLGLSKDHRIAEAAAKALGKYGFGSGASRFLSGSYIPHKKLEEKIARFKGTEAALVFNTGYSANTGIIPALVGDEDTIFSDELNHASIIDGIKLSRAKVKIFRHRDMDHLEKLLKQTCHVEAQKTRKTIPPYPPLVKGGGGDCLAKSSAKKLIITDTIFSMDGDIAPLKNIVFLSKKYGAMLMIDDAHGTGVLGRTGRGGLEHFDIKASASSAQGIIQMGTLSKAFGCFGGFAAGSKDLIDFLINMARSFIYSTSLPPAIAEACIKAIDIVNSESDSLRKKLWANRVKLYQGLKNLGYDTLNSETPIIPILAGDVKSALKMGNYLYKNKIFAPAIRPPTVPEEKCRIRFSVTAAHTDKDIGLVLERLDKFKI
ncbi:MAG: 8-amino-7-oxononanoate synthase [Thermodesulfovibrionia bacterium]|nr:8-amino-7-oxononanoate synthase [Thermodesulfovibrionia bacterium]